MNFTSGLILNLVHETNIANIFTCVDVFEHAYLDNQDEKPILANPSIPAYCTTIKTASFPPSVLL